MSIVEIRDIGATVRQVIAPDAPPSTAPELLPVIVGLHRQVAVKAEAGTYAGGAVDILLADLLATSVLDTASVHAYVTNEFGEFEIPVEATITDLYSCKRNSGNTALQFPPYLRVLRTSQTVSASGVLTVDDSSVIETTGNKACVVAADPGMTITITDATYVTSPVLKGDILELNDVNNANVLRRFRVAVDAAAETVLTLEDKDPDGLGVDIASGTHTNIRVFRPVYTVTDSTASFLNNRTRPVDDPLADGSKLYPQPDDNAYPHANTAQFTGLKAFVNYTPTVGTGATWRLKTWTSNTVAILDPSPSATGTTGLVWAGPPMDGLPAVRYTVTTEEPATGRVPLATGDVTMSFIAQRHDLVAVPTRIQGALQAIETFGSASADNPLGLAMYMAATACPTREIMGLAVATNDVVGHGAALETLVTEEDPYDLVPLCTEASVISLYHSHVTALSQPEERKERTLTFSVPIPVRGVKQSLASSIINVSSLTITVTGGLMLTNGVAPGNYLELVDVDHSNTLRKFLITHVIDETRCTVSDTNPDSVGTLHSGSTHTLVKFVTANYTAAQKIPILTAAAQAYQDRRLTMVLPDRIFVSLSGTEVEVDGTYAAACIAAMYCNYDPGKPLSLEVVPGISRISGSNSQFSHNQLKTLTSSGILLLTQTSALTSPIIRFECSTDTTNKKVQQRSFTRIVDSLAKSLRAALNGILGRDRMTDEFIKKANVTIAGVLEDYKEKGRISAYSIEDFGISESDATALAVTLIVTIPNVGNNIDITLVV